MHLCSNICSVVFIFYLFDSIFSRIVWIHKLHEFDEGISFPNNGCNGGRKKTIFHLSFQIVAMRKMVSGKLPLGKLSPRKLPPPPRKLTPRKSSPTKISSYEYSPLWMLPLWKLPPRNLPAWENYPHEFPSPFRNHTNERKTKITKTFASKKAVQHKSLR